MQLIFIKGSSMLLLLLALYLYSGRPHSIANVRHCIRLQMPIIRLDVKKNSCCKFIF